MKSIKFILLMYIITVLFISCGNDDDSGRVPQTLLTKYTSSNSVTIYHYDKNNRATGYDITYTTPGSNYSAIYTYNNLGQLAEVLYDNESLTDTKDVFSYNSSGQMIKIETYTISGGTETFQYKTQADYSIPGKVSVHYQQSGQLSYLKNEYYVNANGNIATYLTYNNAGELTYTNEYSDYDDKKKSYSTQPEIWYVSSINNYRTVTTTAAGGSTNTATVTFEYNSDGYPVKRTTSTGSMWTYEYVKK